MNMKSKLQVVFCTIALALSTMALTTNLTAQTSNSCVCACCDQCSSGCCDSGACGNCDDCCAGCQC